MGQAFFAILNGHHVVKGRTTIHHKHDGMYIDDPFFTTQTVRVSEISSESEYKKVLSYKGQPIIVVPYLYGRLYLDEQIERHWG